MTTRAPDQRLYDAMLIRAFRRFMSGRAFAGWTFDTFGVWPNKLPLKRCARFFPSIGVRAFVGIYLRPLADRLLDTEPAQDLETLALLSGKWANLDCEERRDREHNEARRRAQLNEARNEAVRSCSSAAYSAAAPNRKPSSMIKVPAGRKR